MGGKGSSTRRRRSIVHRIPLTEVERGAPTRAGSGEGPMCGEGVRSAEVGRLSLTGGRTERDPDARPPSQVKKTDREPLRRRPLVPDSDVHRRGPGFLAGRQTRVLDDDGRGVPGRVGLLCEARRGVRGREKGKSTGKSPERRDHTSKNRLNSPLQTGLGRKAT